MRLICQRIADASNILRPWAMFRALRGSVCVNAQSLMIRASILILLPVSGLPVANASDLEDLARAGYAVVDETQVDGEFEGCDFDKRVPLTNGLVFVCSTYSYSYSFMPDVLILQHVKSGDIKVLIDDDEYDGLLYGRQ